MGAGLCATDGGASLRRAAHFCALGVAAALFAACGARSSLGIGVSSGGGAGTPSGGGAGASSGGSAGSPAIEDAGPGQPDAAPGCSLEDLSSWHTERYRDFGDYERAAVALAGVPWVALKVKGGNIALEKLGVDAQGIVVEDRVEVPGSPVYPVALDVDARRFVMLTTTGINWNGDVELWRIDRASGAVVHVPVGNPPSDPAFTIYSALGLVGDDVVLAYSRIAENEGMIEIRDDLLEVVQSRVVSGSSFTGVRTDGAVDIYVGSTSRVHAEAGALTQSPVDPDWSVIGGLDGFLVQTGTAIRMTRGADVWSADWPHTQISPPAVVRTGAGRAAFSLETELTGVVGYVAGGELQWLRIESAPGASGTGLALLPVVDHNRLGLFYLGLEIPHPEQPLRYYGLACP